MASWMYRGRSLRSNRSIRSRKDSEDEYVQLDAGKDASEVAHEILCNIFKRQGVSEGRKLGYLNAFVNFITKNDVFPNFGYSMDELLCCLRVTLVHEATQVRAAGLRTIRYLIRDEQDVAALIRLNLPALIARSLDLALKNDMERIQAMRVCRRILLHSARLFPRELARSLISLASGGVEERDRMLRVCLALLSELCVLNPDLFISCGGVTAVSRTILESHPPRVTEALAGTLLFLLTRPTTRKSSKVDLDILAAPYSDFHYRHCGWGGDKDDKETHLTSAKLALLSVLRSYPGLLHFSNTGLKSLVDVLTLRQLEPRKAVLDVLYDLLGLPLPSWTDEASVALEAVDPSKLQDSWKLTEGFIAAEGKSILPGLSRVRPNLVEVHTSLLLYCLVRAGILEALVEVIVTSDTFISLRAAILLGELLQMVHTLLPAGCARPSLPSLLAHASGSGDAASRQRALFALSTLSRLHAMFKRRPMPCSLFLDQLLQFSGTWPRENVAGYKLTKTQLYQIVAKDAEDMSIKDSVVLSNKDPFFWNWNVIRAILKNRSDTFKRLEESNQRTFIRRLVEYFMPSSNRFSRLKIGQKHSHPYTLVGCELLDFLVEADEGQGEASKVLSELLCDISEQIAAIQGSKSAHDCLFSPHHVTHSMCQDYFLFIGRLAHHSKGIKALEHAGIFQRLLELVVSTNHDCYVKLIVSSLDYTIEGMSRVILSKVLKSPVESSRIYATRFLLVLVRARVSDFAKWGMELLVMQLYDTSIAVSLTASEILDEACDHKPYLEAVVSLRPSLLHLGDRGLLLLVRFLSLPSGFSYLHDANFVNNELQRWNNVFNIKYVHIVEAALHDALTLHQKSEGGSYTGRLSNAKHVVRDVFLPPHLLGQLAQHARGLELLTRELATLQRHCQIVRAGQYSSDEDVLTLKSSLWCVAHTCSSPGGLQLMTTEADVPGNCALTLVDCLVSLAEQNPHYGVRATAMYACSLVATTQPGAAELDKSGWVCIRHARHERFPVTEDLEGLPNVPVEGELARDSEEITLELRESRRKRSTSQCSSQSAASWAAHFYIDTDEENDAEEPPISPRRESGLGSISPVAIKITQHRRSATLPHAKPARGVKQHQRSLSESKGDVKLGGNLESPRRNSLVEEAKRVRKQGTVANPLDNEGGRFLNVPDSQSGTSPVEKSRSNSCTDSGVSSCDDYLTKPVIGEKVQTLSPIPSSASLSTLKSFGQQVRAHSARTRALSTQEDRVVEVEIDRAVLGASWQDIQGFAALRAMHRFRPHLYSESSVTADILAEEIRSRHGKHASSPPSLPDMEIPLRRVASSLSSVCSRPLPHVAPQHPSACYRGIALPRDLTAMLPVEGYRTSRAQPRRKRGPESFSELEEVQEAGNEMEDREVSSLSDSDASPDATCEHDAMRCLVCACIRPPAPAQQLARGRRVSTGSHRTRTDTESSGERLCPGDSPVLGKRVPALLAATATPNSASSMSSLDLGMSQRTEDDAAALSKHAVKKEILKHVERLSNPVWTKSSRQVLLQLKQKFPASFHDTCLYSDVCNLLGGTTYRLSARRAVQELFYDCPFDEMFEEPASILKLQESASLSSAQASPYNSPSITVAEPLELLEPSKSRPLDVVTEEHSAASGSGDLVDVRTSQHSPTVLHAAFLNASAGNTALVVTSLAAGFTSTPSVTSQLNIMAVSTSLTTNLPTAALKSISFTPTTTLISTTSVSSTQNIMTSLPTTLKTISFTSAPCVTSQVNITAVSTSQNITSSLPVSSTTIISSPKTITSSIASSLATVSVTTITSPKSTSNTSPNSVSPSSHLTTSSSNITSSTSSILSSQSSITSSKTDISSNASNFSVKPDIKWESLNIRESSSENTSSQESKMSSDKKVSSSKTSVSPNVTKSSITTTTASDMSSNVHITMSQTVNVATLRSKLDTKVITSMSGAHMSTQSYSQPVSSASIYGNGASSTKSNPSTSANSSSIANPALQTGYSSGSVKTTQSSSTNVTSGNTSASVKTPVTTSANISSSASSSKSSGKQSRGGKNVTPTSKNKPSPNSVMKSKPPLPPGSNIVPSKKK